MTNESSEAADKAERASTEPLVELIARIELMEGYKLTDDFAYARCLFLLHHQYAQAKNLEAACQVLEKLIAHFQKGVNPHYLADSDLLLYIKSWTYLGCYLSELERTQEALSVFRKSFLVLLLICGAESAELETLKWYIRSVELYGKITSDEPEPGIFEDEEGQRCSFCLTGQVEISGGPLIYACRNCVENFTELKNDNGYAAHLRLIAGADADCSFNCSGQSAYLFPGPGVFVCSNCLLRLKDELN